MNTARWPLVIALVGCGPAPVMTIDDVTLTSGDATLVVRAKPLGLELRRGAALVARTLEPALELGVLDGADPKFYPDPLSEGTGVVARRFAHATAAARDGDGWKITVEGEGAAATLAVRPEPDGSFAFALAPSTKDVVQVRLHLAAGAGEHFYGLGE